MTEPTAALRVWLHRLKASEPAAREESIKALETLGETDALAGLAEVFATDSEAELRGLAQWAGKSIYYRAIRQTLGDNGASEEERQRAAEILAQAQAKKTQERSMK